MYILCLHKIGSIDWFATHQQSAFGQIMRWIPKRRFSADKFVADPRHYSEYDFADQREFWHFRSLSWQWYGTVVAVVVDVVVERYIGWNCNCQRWSYSIRSASIGRSTIGRSLRRYSHAAGLAWQRRNGQQGQQYSAAKIQMLLSMRPGPWVVLHFAQLTFGAAV